MGIETAIMSGLGALGSGAAGGLGGVLGGIGSMGTGLGGLLGLGGTGATALGSLGQLGTGAMSALGGLGGMALGGPTGGSMSSIPMPSATGTSPISSMWEMASPTNMNKMTDPGQWGKTAPQNMSLPTSPSSIIPPSLLDFGGKLALSKLMGEHDQPQMPPPIPLPPMQLTPPLNMGTGSMKPWSVSDYYLR